MDVDVIKWPIIGCLPFPVQWLLVLCSYVRMQFADAFVARHVKNTDKWISMCQVNIKTSKVINNTANTLGLYR